MQWRSHELIKDAYCKLLVALLRLVSSGLRKAGSSTFPQGGKGGILGGQERGDREEHRQQEESAA